jgi:hypothetical protein
MGLGGRDPCRRRAPMPVCHTKSSPERAPSTGLNWSLLFAIGWAVVSSQCYLNIMPSAAVLVVSRSSCGRSHIAWSFRLRDKGPQCLLGAEGVGGVLFASAESRSRIVAAHGASIPFVVVVGQREAEQGTVSLRERTSTVSVLSLNDAVIVLRTAYESRLVLA